MAEMWGIAGGARNFIQDRMQLQRLALDAQEAQNVERHRQAQRVATNTELQQRERRLVLEEDAAARAERVREEMSKPGEDEDLSTPIGQIQAFRQRAARLLALGEVEEAAKLSNTAAQTLVRFENAARAEAERERSEFALVSDQTRRLQEALTGVRSQEDFDRARLSLAAMPEMAENLNHPLLQRYDPQLIGRFVQNAPAWVKQQELSLRERQLRSADALRQARIAYMNAQADISKRQVAVSEAREARLEKAGAVSAGGGGSRGGSVPPAAKPPTTAARTEVQIFLKSNDLLSSDPGMRNLQISSITEDAMTLVQRNRGIASYSEAVQMAVENAKARGELVQEKNALGRPRGMFKQQAGSVARPINITPGRKVDYKENMHYRDPAGNVVRYQDGKFIPVYSANPRQVVQPQMPSANNPLLDMDEDEEGEE